MPNIFVIIGSGYRYGFNGKEVDSEGLGGGKSTYDYVKASQGVWPPNESCGWCCLQFG